MAGIAVTPSFIWYNNARNEESFSWDGETLSFRDKDLFADFSQLGYNSLKSREIHLLPLSLDPNILSEGDKSNISKFVATFFAESIFPAILKTPLNIIPF